MKIEKYTPEELEIVHQHIKHNYGDAKLFKRDDTGMNIDIYIVEPTTERNYYILLTCGMGAYRMNVPDEMADSKVDRAELAISLPADWNIYSEEYSNQWPVENLEALAHMPMSESSWMGWGHTISRNGDRPVADNAGFNSFVLLNNASRDICPLPDGSEVNFYDIVPLYPEEVAYKMRHDTDALLQLFNDDEDDICLMPVDINRKNVCEKFRKVFYIPSEDIKQVLKEWNDVSGCIVSDRIMVDGCKVGHCYRVRPSDGARTWDSGWRFLAGDESSEYLDDPDNYGSYSLNTICNYDRDVLNILRAPYGSVYHRSEDDGVLREEAPESDERPAPLLSAVDITELESMDDGHSGYFYKMASYLDDFVAKGIEEKRFTMAQAREDLDIALWYAFAYNNIGEYEYYYRTIQWMPASEKNAKGCGTWFYRYGVALEYCGKLLPALEYLEKGVLEDPEYPWGWLQLAKLRAHFGNIEGALEAVQKGLELVPGDYEFITLQREIGEGRKLEEMEYHYIHPDADQELMDGNDDDADDKLISVKGIVCDSIKLRQLLKAMDLRNWEADSPYCSGTITVQGVDLDIVFAMNAAYLSKMDKNWLVQQVEALNTMPYLERTAKLGKLYKLNVVIINRYQAVIMDYVNDDGEKVRMPLFKEDYPLGLAEAGAVNEVDKAIEQAEYEREHGGNIEE